MISIPQYHSFPNSQIDHCASNGSQCRKSSIVIVVTDCSVAAMDTSHGIALFVPVVVALIASCIFCYFVNRCNDYRFRRISFREIVLFKPFGRSPRFGQPISAHPSDEENVPTIADHPVAPPRSGESLNFQLIRPESSRRSTDNPTQSTYDII